MRWPRITHRPPTNDVNGSPELRFGVLRICAGFDPVSLDSIFHGNDNRGYEFLKMIYVGARRAVPLQMICGSPELRFGVLRICRGFDAVSLDSRFRGNDNRGYEFLKMIYVGVRE